MSTVSGVVICTHCGETDPGEDGPDDPCLWQRIDAWLVEHGHKPLVRVEDHAVTQKHPQMSIAAGGLNVLDEDAFSAFVMSLPWRYPENVVLVLEPEEGATRVFRRADESGAT